MLSAFFFILSYSFPALFQYDLSYVVICDDFLLQHYLLPFLCFYISFIHLYLFLPLTCVIVRSPCFDGTKFYGTILKIWHISRVLKMLSCCHLPEHKLKLILAIRLMRKPYREFFHCWKGLAQECLIHNQIWSQRCWANAVGVVWSITELLLFAIERTGKICLPHFCLACIKEEKLKQVGVKSCFLTKLNTTYSKSVQVQWIFNACGGGCTFSVIRIWCYCTLSFPLKALFDHWCQHTCLAKVQARTTAFSQDLQF